MKDMSKIGWVSLLGLSVLCLITQVSGYKNTLEKWEIQTSSKVSVSGADVAKSNFDAQGWYKVEGPATVMAGLIQNGMYPNVFYDVNLQSVSREDFEVPWWYR